LLTIRKAELRDVPQLYQLINHYAAERVTLPRSLADLYENLWEFTVAEEDGKLLGCGALKFYNQEIAELRSLCVEVRLKSNGVGRRIAQSLLSEAERFGLKTVFALTVAPAFFGKLGFREVPRESFPDKVWRDCLSCERYAACNEKAVALDLVLRPTPEAEYARETAGVSR
jgi:amino-acid N-acetyltransferase